MKPLKQTKCDQLEVALLHLSVKAGDLKANRTQLVENCRKAAKGGAQLIVGPEMSLSGYCFESRDDIISLTEPAKGPTAQALSEISKSFGVFIVAAWAERDETTEMLYNSAFVFDPTGQLLCRYRKVNAESRWACPGDSSQNNVFKTPWGQMGLLICADSYHSLMPRITALKGADLLILPANWPQTGSLPEDLWKFRSAENGFWLMAVNRTGKEKNLDCRKAKSYLFGPVGQDIICDQSRDSAIFTASIPLDDQGHLTSFRTDILKTRRPGQYHRSYGNLSSIRNLTSFLKLPEPGLLDLYCLPTFKKSPVEFLADQLSRINPGCLVLLPDFNYEQVAMNKLQTMAQKAHILVAAAKNKGEHFFLRGELNLDWNILENEKEPIFDYGPARVIFSSLNSMRHPEAALSASKEGCDLALISGTHLNPDDFFLVRMRPIDQLPIAACASNGAAIGLIPEGHQSGRGAISGSEICSYVLDTKATRDKRFQDRIDFRALFNKKI